MLVGASSPYERLSETMVGDAAVRDRGKWLAVISSCLLTPKVTGCEPWLFAVIACKTRFTLIDDPDDYIRMEHADYPDVLWSGCIMKVVRMSVLCQRRLLFLWIGEAETLFAFPWGGPGRKTVSCVSLGESGWWWSGW